MKSERTISSIRILRTYPSPDGGQWHTEGRRSVSEIRETGENKKVTFPTGGGYSPFIFRLISIQDGKKFGAPLLRRSSSKRKKSTGIVRARHAIIRSTMRKSISAACSYQSRITPKPSSYVRSHRSTRSQTLSFEKREGCGEECRVELSLEGGKWVKGGEGAAVEGWKRLSEKTMGILAGVPW